jgi:hypothetical protein
MSNMRVKHGIADGQSSLQRLARGHPFKGLIATKKPGRSRALNGGKTSAAKALV